MPLMPFPLFVVFFQISSLHFTIEIFRREKLLVTYPKISLATV